MGKTPAPDMIPTQTAPQMAVEYLSERLRRKTDDIAQAVGEIALPCGVDVCEPGVCGKTYDEVRRCAEQLQVDTMVEITNATDTRNAELEDQTRRDQNFPEALNRIGLQEAYEKHQKDRQPGDKVAVLFVDLDKFKAINDAGGHDLGDKVIAGHIDRLKRAVRGEDAVGRPGGDELVVIANIDGANEKAISDFVDRIKEPIAMEDGLTSTCSVGVVFAEPGEEYGSAVGKADEAMYSAKQRGGNQAAFWQPKESNLHALGSPA